MILEQRKKGYRITNKLLFIIVGLHIYLRISLIFMVDIVWMESITVCGGVWGNIYSRFFLPWSLASFSIPRTMS